MVECAFRIDKQHFEKYAPLLKDLKLEKPYSTYGNLLTIVRRLNMLVMAMFILDRQWLQLQVFIALNLISVIYAVAVMPYDTSLLNFLSIFNEVIGLVASYFMIPL